MQNRLPSWFRQELPDSSVKELREELEEGVVHTVCQEARCPNINSCFKERAATFLILGKRCTRSCAFCAVKKDPRGQAPDPDEPARVAAAVRKMGLDYAVVTSVTRDDLPDGGAGVFIDTISRIRDSSPNAAIELLIPDFKGDEEMIRRVSAAGPDVVGHNLETISRLYPLVRPQADYKRSLGLLRFIKELNPKMITKSSLILGLGESREEVAEAMRDLKTSGCDILVLGQYLRPSAGHYPVKRFIEPGEFDELAKLAKSMGFGKALCAPKARSSYRACSLYRELNYA